ncbi:hypothetical protein E2C01_003517 [Portunus trituberculatus]|uniref:Uncharacterized protein n=1 Tax=Portunus trituberculatus TaxID=210409 RepID=A0A5B7CTS4_PORTR|nr:hypothetical protein [Portunus trituberculatus]
MVMVVARLSGQWVVRGLRGRALYLRPGCPTTSVVFGRRRGPRGASVSATLPLCKRLEKGRKRSTCGK